MCGINGIISTKKLCDMQLRLGRMNESIKHRGPDAQGIKILGNEIGFGHTRLSIIDLDARSNQPMVSAKGNMLIFNGEIYNFKEIKKHISDYKFLTESDTEVLLAGIETRGIDWLLDNINGMFSFAYYDNDNNEIIIVRDRLGIKPCYYYVSNDSFIFSSEIKGILNSGLVSANFYESAIDEYLANRYVRAPFTFFKNIYQLEPGSLIRVSVSDNKIMTEKSKYWELPEDFNMDNEYDEEKICEEFEKKVIESIKKRMVADVTVGTYLSGGIDSSLISAIASINTDRQINTYTIGFDDLNEYQYADIVAKKYLTNHHEIKMSEGDYWDALTEVIGYKDSPLGVPNEIPLAKMSKVLCKDITVVLSGEGADELMGGYGRIFRSAFDYSNIKKFQQNSFYQYFIGKYEYVPRRIRNKYLNISCDLRNYWDEIVEHEFCEHGNEENVFRFFHEYHVKGLLQRVDTTTMLASVEARVPFLDHELIEFCYKKVPYELKLKWKEGAEKQIKDTSDIYSEILDTPKYLLKKVARKYLPDEIIDRKKVGFPVPLNNWILDIENKASDILRDAYWLKADVLEEMINDCGTEERAGQIIWMFINIEIFRKMYFEREWRY
ncbi:asparagine synthase (glutamine-hydrolyzing) [Pseudobutyrivibrio sp. LB2011]|uniref:asparagine synthase (glutamine-hydrolyzing) n=1 Tax=Pseudobutyrivibrio sp. LB2011 TaxID=1408312 RepID=UPI0005D20DFF|nr:asparagine synthase (glutamine-hydrolyzing) [Pseudobutyrivibrio sp. LB2011]